MRLLRLLLLLSTLYWMADHDLLSHDSKRQRCGRYPQTLGSYMVPI